MALFTEEEQIMSALEQSKTLAEEEALTQALLEHSKALADEEALAQALEDLVIQESKQDSEPSREDILAMICASQEGAAEGNDSLAEPSEEKEERQDLFEDKPVEDTMPSIFHDGNLIIFACPHCGRALSVSKGETNCRQFVCVGKSDGTFANPHASRDECMTLLSRDWFGCGEAFTLPEDGSPPIKRAHG